MTFSALHHGHVYHRNFSSATSSTTTVTNHRSMFPLRRNRNGNGPQSVAPEHDDDEHIMTIPHQSIVNKSHSTSSLPPAAGGKGVSTTTTTGGKPLRSFSSSAAAASSSTDEAALAKAMALSSIHKKFDSGDIYNDYTDDQQQEQAEEEHSMSNGRDPCPPLTSSSYSSLLSSDDEGSATAELGLHQQSLVFRSSTEDDDDCAEDGDDFRMLKRASPIYDSDEENNADPDYYTYGMPSATKRARRVLGGENNNQRISQLEDGSFSLVGLWRPAA